MVRKHEKKIRGMPSILANMASKLGSFPILNYPAVRTYVSFLTSSRAAYEDNCHVAIGYSHLSSYK